MTGSRTPKKQVLVFIEDGSFTYDNRIIRETNALVADGWKVIVISPKYPDDPLYKKLGPRLHAYYYPKPTAESAFGHVLEHSLSLLFGTILTFWVAIRHGFRVFHACNPLDVLWLIAMPYKLLGKRFVFDQHDLCPELYLSRGEGGNTSFFYRALMFLERKSYQKADAVIATNESYKRIAIERGGKEAESVFVVRNGPDLEKFRRVAPKPGLKNEGELLVGYLGNMNRQDGVDTLLHVARNLKTNLERENVRFVFIGGGSCQTELSEQAQDMGLGDCVMFTGRIPDEDMLAVLSACDVCVQPDPKNPLNDKSTMNKVMEYMALEIPVVAFDLTETRVSCGEAALYATPNDVEDFSKKLVELLDDPDRRQEMGQLGRQRIENKLSWQYSVPNLLAAYEYATTS